MSRLVGSLLVLLAAATLSATEEPLVGVAARKGETACVAFKGALLPDGMKLTLVFADAPQRTAAAFVKRRLDSCDPLDDAGVEGNVYEIMTDARDSSWVVMAVLVPTRVEKGLVLADIDGQAPSETFAVCASQEGLHLTVWSGKPKKSRRMWHEYYYLGYDVEPTCSAAEVTPP